MSRPVTHPESFVIIGFLACLLILYLLTCPVTGPLTSFPTCPFVHYYTRLLTGVPLYGPVPVWRFLRSRRGRTGERENISETPGCLDDPEIPDVRTLRVSRTDLRRPIRLGRPPVLACTCQYNRYRTGSEGGKGSRVGR